MIPRNDWFPFTNHFLKVRPGSKQHIPVHQIERTEQINGLSLDRLFRFPPPDDRSVASPWTFIYLMEFMEKARIVPGHAFDFQLRVSETAGDT